MATPTKSNMLGDGHTRPPVGGVVGVVNNRGLELSGDLVIIVPAMGGLWQQCNDGSKSEERRKHTRGIPPLVL